MENPSARNIETNIEDFYKLVGEASGKLLKEGLASHEDLDNLVQLSAQRAIVDASSRIISPALALAIYGGYKYFAVDSGELQTQIVFFGAVASFVLTFVATIMVMKILPTREKLGCLATTIFSASILLILVYAGYLLFFRGLYYPFFGPDGMSLGGFGMALVFISFGVMISKADLVISCVERAVTHNGIELVVEKLEEDRRDIREFVQERMSD